MGWFVFIIEIGIGIERSKLFDITLEFECEFVESPLSLGVRIPCYVLRS